MKTAIAAAISIAIMGGQVALAQPPFLVSSAQDKLRQSMEEEQARSVSSGQPADLGDQVNPDAEQVLDLDQLSDLRGGETVTTQLTTQNLNAVNSGNSISAGDSVGSGAVNLNANAFNGYDGIGNFVINTGHNNNLMGSVSVNVLVTPQ